MTVTLTEEQVDLAAHSQSLWTQGGLPDDPVLNDPYPGRYGYAALRCAIDAYNGDNVEWISFPTGATHVYCYAYYVTPPPASGQIIVRKVVEGEDAPTQTFRFDGQHLVQLEQHLRPDGRARQAGGHGRPLRPGAGHRHDAALGLHGAGSRRLQARLDRLREQPRQPHDVAASPPGGRRSSCWPGTS